LPAAVSLVSLEPLSVVLAAWAIHGLRPSRLEQAGVLTATAGAVIVARGAGTGDHRLFGDLLVVGAVALYGIYVSAARGLKDALPPRPYAALVYLAAAASLAPFLLLLPHADLVAMPPHGALAIALLALVPTILGHTMVQTAARTLRPSVIAIVSPGETLGAVVIGAVLLGAVPSGDELAGALVILAGAAIALYGSDRR
jgi:drug/metabolite transporter (DMT)-like permease